MADASGSGGVANGDLCRVTTGTHKGKSGIVEDRNISRTGHVTLTIRQADGIRLKTLERNVTRIEPE